MHFFLLNRLKFILHNKKYFKSNFSYRDETILVEINNFYPNLILVSYLVNQLSLKYKAKINGYFPGRSINKIKKFKQYLLKKIPFSRVSIYKSFCVNDTIDLNFYKNKINYKLFELQVKKLKKNTSKNKILNLKIDDICIGDLLYDDYLRKTFKATIDLKDDHFLKFAYEFIKTFYCWKYYLSTNTIKAIVLSHHTYENGLPLRIAQKFNIPVYIPDPAKTYFFNKKKKFTLDNSLNFELLNSLSIKEKFLLFNNSRKILKKKFNPKHNFFVETNSGEKDINIPNIKKKIPFEKNFFPSNKKKILVSCHCFYDSPHVFGRFFFSDFFEWLQMLNKISKKTDYLWYLKKHPHSVNHKLADQILQKFVDNNNKFKIISESIDNRLLKNHIDFVLTIHGAVAYEFAYMNKPVILASNPLHYKDYSFCIKPKNKKEYINTLMNLDKIKSIKINKKEIIKFYVVNFLCLDNFGKILNLKKILKKLYFTPYVYKLWLNKFTYVKHKKLLDKISKFLNSKKSMMWDKKLIKR